MRLGTMLEDVLPSLVRRPFTERYPLERRPPPERLRGLLAWDRLKCTGCGMCATDCPSQAIEVLVYDKKAKRIVFRFHTDRCTFCAQCTFSCRQGCLALDPGVWELAGLDREGMVLTFGGDDDLALVRAGVLPADKKEDSGE